jgi:hypothetical protein
MLANMLGHRPHPLRLRLATPRCSGVVPFSAYSAASACILQQRHPSPCPPPTSSACSQPSAPTLRASHPPVQFLAHAREAGPTRSWHPGRTPRRGPSRRCWPRSWTRPDSPGCGSSCTLQHCPPWTSSLHFLLQWPCSVRCAAGTQRFPPAGAILSNRLAWSRPTQATGVAW